MKEDFVKQKIPFTQVANDVLNDKNLSLNAKGLYAYIYSKPNGWDFSYIRIASELKESKNSVLKYIQELEGAGLLTRKRLSTGRVQYKIHIKPLTKDWVEEKKPQTKKATDQNYHSGKFGHISNKDIKVIKNINNKDILFDQFWSEYPRKTAKVVARKSWAKINPDQELSEKIIKSVENYKKSSQWKNPKYIPHPATFLNQGRWEDEIEFNGKEAEVLEL